MSFHGLKTLDFEASGWVPNNPELPVVVMPGAIDVRDEDVHALYRRNRWGGCWTWGVFDYHHYHSNAHEVLGCIRGSACLMLGGDDGEEIEVAPGDVLVLPAGTGHKLLRSDRGFQVCGAYPQGQEERDLLRATKENWTARESGSRTSPCPQPIRCSAKADRCSRHGATASGE